MDPQKPKKWEGENSHIIQIHVDMWVYNLNNLARPLEHQKKQTTKLMSTKLKKKKKCFLHWIYTIPS